MAHGRDLEAGREARHVVGAGGGGLVRGARDRRVEREEDALPVELAERQEAEARADEQRRARVEEGGRRLARLPAERGAREPEGDRVVPGRRGGLKGGEPR